MRAAREDVLALNLGDPAAHGLPPAREAVQTVRDQLDDSCGYSAAGPPDARDAVAGSGKRLDTVRSCDIYLGNGFSELAPLAPHALLDPHHQVVIPAPDYPMYRLRRRGGSSARRRVNDRRVVRHRAGASSAGRPLHRGGAPGPAAAWCSSSSRARSRAWPNGSWKTPSPCATTAPSCRSISP